MRAAGARAHSDLMERGPTTGELGDLYRRRAIAEAVAGLDEGERAVAELRHRDGTAPDAIGQRLDLDPERSRVLLASGHRHLIGALPWLTGDHRCIEARAALLAGVQGPVSLDHVRHCTACPGVDLLAVQTVLAHPAAWDGTWLADAVYWADAQSGHPSAGPLEAT
jgi:hypothetical protein